jgi:hypothetical protein
MTRKYAILDNQGKFLKSWDPAFNGKHDQGDILEKAKLYTLDGLKPHLSIFVKRKYKIVPVEISIVTVGQPVMAGDALQVELDKLQLELDELSAVDVDTLSDAQYRRLRRLARVIEYADLSILNE